MKYYAVAEIEITDQSWVPAYIKNVTRLVEQRGGRYLARTSRIEKLEGERKVPPIFLIIEWPSKDVAKAFYECDEYRPYRQGRLAGATNEFLLVAGEDMTGTARISEDKLSSRTRRSAEPSAPIELIPASVDQQPILANLFELYAHDFSGFYDLELGPDGRFGYIQLPLYWSEPDRHPFIVRIDGKWAGFALVKKGSEVSGDETAWDLAEFFVVRKYRRRGIGTQVAQELWRRFPGPWEVRVLQSNVFAHPFWVSAIAMFTGHAVQPVRVEKDGDSWDLFSFESKRA